MGGQQAFQWAVSYPQFMDRVVVTAATAKTYPHGVVRLEGQIATITADPVFKDGDYSEPPMRGLDAFGTVWAGWLFSQQWWRDELWRAGASPGTTFEQVFGQFRHDFVPGADANDLILQMRTWEQHDVGTTPGFSSLQQALGAIPAVTLILGRLFHAKGINEPPPNFANRIRGMQLTFGTLIMLQVLNVGWLVYQSYWSDR